MARRIRYSSPEIGRNMAIIMGICNTHFAPNTWSGHMDLATAGHTRAARHRTELLKIFELKHHKCLNWIECRRRWPVLFILLAKPFVLFHEKQKSVFTFLQLVTYIL